MKATRAKSASMAVSLMIVLNVLPFSSAFAEWGSGETQLLSDIDITLTSMVNGVLSWTYYDVDAIMYELQSASVNGNKTVKGYLQDIANGTGAWSSTDVSSIKGYLSSIETYVANLPTIRDELKGAYGSVNWGNGTTHNIGDYLGYIAYLLDSGTIKVDSTSKLSGTYNSQSWTSGTSHTVGDLLGNISYLLNNGTFKVDATSKLSGNYYSQSWSNNTSHTIGELLGNIAYVLNNGTLKVDATSNLKGSYKNQSWSSGTNHSAGDYLGLIAYHLKNGTIKVTGATINGSDLTNIETALTGIATSLTNIETYTRYILENISDSTRYQVQGSSTGVTPDDSIYYYIKNMPSQGTGSGPVTSVDLSTIEGILGNLTFLSDGATGHVLKVYDAGNYSALGDMYSLLDYVHTDVFTMRSDLSRIKDLLNNWYSQASAEDAIEHFDFNLFETRTNGLLSTISTLAPFGSVLLLSECVAILTTVNELDDPSFTFAFDFFEGHHYDVNVDLSWCDDLKPTINFFAMLLLVMGLAMVTLDFVKLEAAA